MKVRGSQARASWSSYSVESVKLSLSLLWPNCEDMWMLPLGRLTSASGSWWCGSFCIACTEISGSRKKAGVQHKPHGLPGWLCSQERLCQLGNSESSPQIQVWHREGSALEALLSKECSVRPAMVTQHMDTAKVIMSNDCIIIIFLVIPRGMRDLGSPTMDGNCSPCCGSAES